MAPPWKVEGEALILSIRVTPRGGRDALGGVVAGADGRAHLQIRVTAPPTDGAANAAVLKLIARTLGARKSDVTLVSGATARVKKLSVRGDAASMAARLAALVKA